MARTKRKNLLKLENKDEEDDDPEDDQQQEQQQQADEEQEQQEQAEEDQNGGEQAEEEDENANLEVRVQRLLIIIPSLPAESSKQAENVAPAMAAASTSQDDNDRVKILPKRKQQQQQVQLKMMKQQKRQQQQQQQEQRKILMKKTFRKLLATSSPPGLRAAFLKRRLERIGGLNPWLRSQGLGQFAKIFQEQKVSEPQLLNLTMQALKKLGVVPVGPRRKLICAIDQLCKTL